MFKLVESLFLQNNRCKYEDEYGNTATFFRKDYGFDAKLRFKREGIKAETTVVKMDELPLKGEDCGVVINLSSNGANLSELEIQQTVRNYGILLQRWVDMCEDIKYVTIDNEYIKKSDSRLTDTQIVKEKMRLIAKYEELKPVFDIFFSDNVSGNGNK